VSKLPAETANKMEATNKRASWAIRVLLPAAAFVAGLSLLGSLAVPRHRSLLERAIRVPGFTIHGPEYPIDWGWASQNELVYLKGSQPTAVHRVDIVTGKETQTPVHRFKSAPGGATTWGSYGNISPNGRAILYANPHSVLDLSTGRARRTPGPDWWQWSSDGESLLQQTTKGITTLRLADFRPQEHSIPGIKGEFVLWFDGRNSIVSSRPRPGIPRHAQFTEFTLGPIVTARSLPIRLIGSPALTSVDLSPSGDRVAWWVDWRDGRQSWATRVVLWLRGQRSSSAAAGGYEGVLVSNRDGSEMRELGRVWAEYAPDGLGAVKWMPDGKRLCIVYRRGFYIVPVD
jgi:hypothetical protein